MATKELKKRPPEMVSFSVEFRSKEEFEGIIEKRLPSFDVEKSIAKVLKLKPVFLKSFYEIVEELILAKKYMKRQGARNDLKMPTFTEPGQTSFKNEKEGFKWYCKKIGIQHPSTAYRWINKALGQLPKSNSNNGSITSSNGKQKKSVACPHCKKSISKAYIKKNFSEEF